MTKIGFVSLCRVASPIEDWQRLLAPEYPGISDAPTISDWDPPFPMDLGRIRKVDEDYWNRYRATPKRSSRSGCRAEIVAIALRRRYGYANHGDSKHNCGPRSIP